MAIIIIPVGPNHDSPIEGVATYQYQTVNGDNNNNTDAASEEAANITRDDALPEQYTNDQYLEDEARADAME